MDIEKFIGTVFIFVHILIVTFNEEIEQKNWIMDRIGRSNRPARDFCLEMQA